MQSIGFIIGYMQESFGLTSRIWLVGVALAMLVVVPPWPFLLRGDATGAAARRWLSNRQVNEGIDALEAAAEAREAEEKAQEEADKAEREAAAGAGGSTASTPGKSKKKGKQ